MSEYQYYEFQAIDRPLNQREMQELRALSTRATITPTKFMNVYNWGNFRGDPATLMEKYFDAFVYVANWGTHEFMLRLPQRLLDPEVAIRYCMGEYFQARTAGSFVILDFRSEEEGADMVDDVEGILASLIPLRAELAGGDLRALYLGWLADAQMGEMDDDDLEPPPPPGLHNLSASQDALADFLRIDGDLLEVATEGSAKLDETQPSRRAIEQWILSLPESEKNGLLLRLMEEGDPYLRAELLQRFRHATTPAADRRRGHVARTVGQLLAAAEQREETRRRAEAERAAQERAQREREQAAARARYLARLADREAEAWQQVDTLIAAKRPADYDQAIQLLIDLRDLSRQAKQTDMFEARVRQLREQHARKPSLIQRFDHAGLGVVSGIRVLRDH